MSDLSASLDPWGAYVYTSPPVVAVGPPGVVVGGPRVVVGPRRRRWWPGRGPGWRRGRGRGGARGRGRRGRFGEEFDAAGEDADELSVDYDDYSSSEEGVEIDLVGQEEGDTDDEEFDDDWDSEDERKYMEWCRMKKEQKKKANKESVDIPEAEKTDDQEEADARGESLLARIAAQHGLNGAADHPSGKGLIPKHLLMAGCDECRLVDPCAPVDPCAVVDPCVPVDPCPPEPCVPVDPCPPEPCVEDQCVAIPCPDVCPPRFEKQGDFAETYACWMQGKTPIPSIDPYAQSKVCWAKPPVTKQCLQDTFCKKLSLGKRFKHEADIEFTPTGAPVEKNSMRNRALVKIATKFDDKKKHMLVAAMVTMADKHGKLHEELSAATPVFSVITLDPAAQRFDVDHVAGHSSFKKQQAPTGAAMAVAAIISGLVEEANKRLS